jgi:hypothetical protein
MVASLLVGTIVATRAILGATGVLMVATEVDIRIAEATFLKTRFLAEESLEIVEDPLENSLKIKLPEKANCFYYFESPFDGLKRSPASKTNIDYILGRFWLNDRPEDQQGKELCLLFTLGSDRSQFSIRCYLDIDLETPEVELSIGKEKFFGQGWEVVFDGGPRDREWINHWISEKDLIKGLVI